jgi:hypothetical protein
MPAMPKTKGNPLPEARILGHSLARRVPTAGLDRRYRDRSGCRYGPTLDQHRRRGGARRSSAARHDNHALARANAAYLDEPMKRLLHARHREAGFT